MLGSLIFKEAIFFLWNYKFYCAVGRPDLKNVFVRGLQILGQLDVAFANNIDLHMDQFLRA